MISSLPALSVAIWIAVTISLTVLSSVLAFSHSGVRYPYFAILTHFTTFSCYALLAVGWLASFWTYFWFFYAFRVIADMLTAGVAWEVYRKVYGPAIALPLGARRQIVTKVLVVVATWCVVGSILRAAVGHSYLRKALTAQQMLFGALAGTFCVLILCSRKMGISWRPRVARIAYGFGVILTVNLAMALLKARIQGQVARTADDICQITCLLVYSFWAWCFLEKEQPVPTSAPLELVSALARELKTLKSSTQV